MTAKETTIDQLQPSQAGCAAVSAIYKLASTDLPPLLHEDRVLGRFVEKVEVLPEVHTFQLCECHREKKTALLKSIALAALQDIILATNQNLKEKKRRKEDDLESTNE